MFCLLPLPMVAQNDHAKCVHAFLESPPKMSPVTRGVCYKSLYSYGLTSIAVGSEHVSTMRLPSGLQTVTFDCLACGQRELAEWPAAAQMFGAFNQFWAMWALSSTTQQLTFGMISTKVLKHVRPYAQLT